jgi:drug/metabolite transporter (DMT)-like permease
VDQGLGGIRGQLAIMGAGVSYAVSSVMSRRISHLPSLPAAAGILATGTCYMLPLAFWLEQPLNMTASSQALLALAMLGVLATGLAYVIRLNIIRYNGAVFMSQVGYLVPLFGVFWAWLLLSEQITMQTLFALGAILAGIVITRRGTR